MGFNFATSRIYNVVRILCHSLTCMQRGIIMFTMFSVISFPYMLSVMPESNHRFLNFVHTLLFKIILYYVEIRMIQLLIFVFWKYKKIQDNFKLILMHTDFFSNQTWSNKLLLTNILLLFTFISFQFWKPRNVSCWSFFVSKKTSL